jgi:hypothetical protein
MEKIMILQQESCQTMDPLLPRYFEQVRITERL